MRYLSVCSGIEAATVAWHPLGWEPLAFSEIEPFPCAVLKHHYPNVPNLGDMTAYGRWPALAPDLLVGGTPCQSFSVAGLRKGMADPRGNLALVFLGLVDRFRPRWLVWENVPGVRSVDHGRALGAFLGGLGELGYGWAYRSLDAQYFGLAQRRERVFVVGHLGDWRPPAAVLFEPESLSGDSAPRRDTGERVAPTLASRPTGGGGLGTDFDLDGGVIAFGGNRCSGPIEIATACQANGSPHGRLDFGSETFVVGALTARKGRNGGMSNDDLNARHLVAYAIQERAVSDNPANGPDGMGVREEIAYTLRAQNKVQAVAQIAVRRLTPVECERLQGFPDDFTFVPYRGKPAADGPRYKALGNSMAVPVMRWIGERIDLVEEVLRECARDILEVTS